MMLARIIQFLIGAAFGAGGGYLAWTHRAELNQLFPPGQDGLPVMLIAGVGGLSLGIVFLASAVAPRPKRTARLQAAAARRAEVLRAADAYYAERSRAADRDWRSGKLPPHTPTGAPADPLFEREAVPPKEREAKPDPLFEAPAPDAAPATKSDPLFDSAPAPVEADAAPDPLFDPAPIAAEPEPAQPVAPPPPEPAIARPTAAKPVATSTPPTSMVFPSSATLAPIPKSVDPPPQPIAAAASDRVETAASMHTMPSSVVRSAADTEDQEPEAGFADIRAAISSGRLDEADRLLNESRETATGLALAELTGLAGDHAAAAGRLSNAKWLWRLALKRFGEAGALNSPAARQVSERLRLAGQ